MPRLTIIGHDNRTAQIDAKLGLCVMEIIRDTGFDELPAICGGCCGCATCHVYIEGDVDPGLPEETEALLLDSLEHRADRSRLSCQIAFGPALDGLIVRIAPVD